MAGDSRKVQQNNGKPLTPKAPPIRSTTTGPYLAPRLANSNPRLGSTTPEIRRDARNGTSEIIISRGTNNGSSAVTPVKTFLGTNVTPRSSSRKTRTDSANSTPTSTPGGTPATSRPASMAIPLSEEAAQGLGIQQQRLVASPSGGSVGTMYNGISPPAARPIQTMGIQSDAADSPMFFHASDAGGLLPKKQPVFPAPKSGIGFVYADGRREESNVRPIPQINTKAPSQVSTQSKFYPATTTSRRGESPVMVASSGGASPVTSPKLPPPSTNSTAIQRTRSTSPLKEFEFPGQQTAFKARRTSGGSNLSFRSTAARSAVANLPLQRTVAVSSTPEFRTHVKTLSVGSIGSPKPADTSLFSIQSPQSPHEMPTTPSFFSIQTRHLESDTPPISPLVSPDHAVPSSGESKIDQLNSMAANARRERKVLDLEISNSSLLAINRTLEREMRKQKAELRRYRRLTSNGRISLAPTARSVSGTTTISTLSLDSDRDYRSDEDHSLTDIQSEDDDDLEDSDDSSSSSSSSILSPEAQAAQDTRRNARDEKRLQLDLSKHQQLLIDSQKMNESLKKCLGWTEQLIIEGKKALEYQVRVSEVSIGGRVLHEDDVPEMEDLQPRRGLLSPTVLETGVSTNEMSWGGESPTGTIKYRPDDSYVSTLLDEGKEFREYLDSLYEAETT